MRFFIILLMSILTGCSNLPSPTGVNASMHHARSRAVKFVNEPTTLSRLKWWKRLHDPVLNRLTLEALAHNSEIEIAKANILQAKATLEAARWAWLPNVNAMANGFNLKGINSQFTPELGPLPINPFNRLGNVKMDAYAAGFVPTYSLNILQNISNERYAAAAVAQQSATYDAVRLSIISQVSGSYFMLLAELEKYQTQSQQLNHLKKLHQVELHRYQIGLSDMSALLTLNAQIEQSRANLAAIENNKVQIENTLQVLLNRRPGAIVTQSSLFKLPSNHIIPANISSEVLKSRPDVMIACENLRMSKASIGIEAANYFPKIALTGIFGRVAFNLSQVIKISTGMWLAEGSANAVLLNASVLAKIKAAKANYQAAFNNYVQTITKALADVDTSLMRYEQMTSVVQDQKNALKANQKLAELALVRYQTGAIDIRALLNAKLSVDQSKLNLIQALQQQFDSIVQVYQALGGGYQVQA